MIYIFLNSSTILALYRTVSEEMTKESLISSFFDYVFKFSRLVFRFVKHLTESLSQTVPQNSIAECKHSFECTKVRTI